MKIYVDAYAIEKLKDPDCLSLEATIFRNGGTINGVTAIPCEVLLINKFSRQDNALRYSEIEIELNFD